MKKITAIMLAIIIAVFSTMTVTAAASEPQEKGSDLFETLTSCDPEFAAGVPMEAESLSEFMYHFSIYQWLENCYPDHGVLVQQLDSIAEKLRDCDTSKEFLLTPQEWAIVAAYISTRYGERHYLVYEPEDYATEFAAHYWVYETEGAEDEILVMYMMTPTVFFLEYGHYVDGSPSMEIEKVTCFHLGGN